MGDDAKPTADKLFGKGNIGFSMRCGQAKTPLDSQPPETADTHCGWMITYTAYDRSTPNPRMHRSSTTTVITDLHPIAWREKFLSDNKGHAFCAQYKIGGKIMVICGTCWDFDVRMWISDEGMLQASCVCPPGCTEATLYWDEAGLTTGRSRADMTYPEASGPGK